MLKYIAKILLMFYKHMKHQEYKLNLDDMASFRIMHTSANDWTLNAQYPNVSKTSW
jgi:hypothetical protein